MHDHQTILVAAIGLAAGFLGSLAGLGGSLFMIPLLTIVLGAERYHVFMAAAMCVNVMISAPAAWQHWRKGAISVTTLKWLLPAMAPCIAIGALLSNLFDGYMLARVLGALIILAIIVQLLLLPAPKSEAAATNQHPPEPTPPPSLLKRLTKVHTGAGLIGTGAVTGIISGLMGIGGGVILVSGLQFVARLPLRVAIASSSATICLTAVIGAATKLTTLDQLGFSPLSAISLAAVMGAWGIIGSLLGAHIVHLVPVRILRWIVGLLLIGAAIRLATASPE